MNLRALYLRSKFWLNDFLQGSPIGKPYREITYIQEHSYSQGLPLRDAALRRLLEHAKNNTFFY